MATETPTRENPAVALFQKAHQKMVTLQRLDEQVTAILDQRRKLQEELRDVQNQINGEFERVMKASAEGPAALLTELKPTNGRAPRLAEAAA